MKKKLLCIAYHFPPIQGSTGIHRTLSFAKYLRPMGWDVSVLTVKTRAYVDTSIENITLIPNDVAVIRAFALDASRHLSIRGRYPLLLALPDKWQSWILGGVISGLRHIRKERPDVIWSTYPIASAHYIGMILSTMTGIPWIADFRDPMAQDDYPPEPLIRKNYAWLERVTVSRASAVTVTTNGTANRFREAYEESSDSKMSVIENGFDEDIFATQLPRSSFAGPVGKKTVTFLHSGLLYPSERDPSEFFLALAELTANQQISEREVKIIFRGSGYDDHFSSMIVDLGLTNLVSFLPPIPYKDAVREMLEAQCLLIFQAENCNHQIPAKLYEYLYAERPIVALTNIHGDTAKLLSGLAFESIADLADKESIKKIFLSSLKKIRNGSYILPSRETIMRYSRRARTVEFASLLDSVRCVPCDQSP